ncbi:hypothetical protein Q5P01_001270 [Channa striata]|uniref:Uncharacterized protein n=1 Tax=Channa striata TaxID=64152 RepID=A0AA88T3S5_CHASR|nr:hypothetical protein Q5P01_001270 [Channa striata]
MGSLKFTSARFKHVTHTLANVPTADHKCPLPSGWAGSALHHALQQLLLREEKKKKKKKVHRSAVATAHATTGPVFTSIKATLRIELNFHGNRHE